MWTGFLSYFEGVFNEKLISQVIFSTFESDLDAEKKDPSKKKNEGSCIFIMTIGLFLDAFSILRAGRLTFHIVF